MARYSKKEDVERVAGELRKNLGKEEAKACYENALKIPDGQRVPFMVNNDLVFIAKSRMITIFKEIAGVE